MKKSIKKILCVLLVMGLCFSSYPVYATEQRVNVADNIHNGTEETKGDGNIDSAGQTDVNEGVMADTNLKPQEDVPSGVNNSESTGNNSEEKISADSVDGEFSDDNVDGEEDDQAEIARETDEIPENTEAESYDITEKQDEHLIVNYATHVQYIGWQEPVTDGETAGTTGRGLQMEAMKVSLDNTTSYTGGISYSAHIQNIGWQNPVADGNVAGTTGRMLRIEAVKIELTGDIRNYFDVYYRTHIADVGWMPWTLNGQISGSVGLADRVEAIEIRIVKKDDPNKPEITTQKSYLQGLSNNMLTYSTHVQNIGNTAWVSGGNVTGTTGRGLRVEGININLNQDSANALSGTIKYRTHVQDIGWTEWKILGQYSGTSGRAKRVEAIEIKLTGQLATFYNIYYSAHIQDYGWLGWASNGQASGSTGISYRMEALRINLVRKGNSAPGNTSDYYKNKPVYTPTPKPAPIDAMSQNAQGRTSATSWLIMTDTSKCQVGVYSGSYGHWNRVFLWSCGPGKASTPTVKGEFKVYGRGRSFGSRTYTCWYYTQFCGNYLFHSVLYEHGSMTRIQDGRLGKPVSHGCVRLDINNAKWLYDNIPNGTKVVIY